VKAKNHSTQGSQSHCRGMRQAVRPCENVWSPSPGSLHTQSAGLFHIRCQPAGSVRQMTLRI